MSEIPTFFFSTIADADASPSLAAESLAFQVCPHSSPKGSAKMNVWVAQLQGGEERNCEREN